MKSKIESESGQPSAPARRNNDKRQVVCGCGYGVQQCFPPHTLSSLELLDVRFDAYQKWREI